MESLDVKELVIYAEDESDGPTVTGVREFFVAKALLEGHKEQLSELVPSQWGLTHIFDLCLWFGHDDTALALGRHGVDGCFVLTYHLGPYSKKPQCTCTGYDFYCANCDYDYDTLCNCSLNETCEYCSWGWPVENGTWMKDWDVPLDCAVRAAAQAAQKPLLCELLKMARAGKELPLALPAEGMARLLDIAILTGDREVAAHISKKCQVWPLRRWRDIDMNYACRKHILLAALWAGADFQSIHVLIEDCTIPLQAGIFLCSYEDWQDCAHFFKPAVRGECGPTWIDNNLGLLFYDGRQLSVDKIQGAPSAGIDIRQVSCRFDDSRTVSLLGLAILHGQQDCAVACVRHGLQETREGRYGRSGYDSCMLRDYLHSEASPDHRLVDVATQLAFSQPDSIRSGPECRLAAVAAAQVALRASRQREAAQNGVAICQVMRNIFRSRSFPLAVMDDILTFSAEVPEFVDELDLWDFMDGWMTYVPSAYLDSGMVEESHGTDECRETEDPRASAHEAGTGSASDAPAAPASDPAEAMEVDGKSNDELMTALRASKDQVPVLNMDGVCVFRLTRMATSCHVNQLLLDVTGPLAALHARVLNAGCEVNPEWNVMKALFVPVTEAQMAELQGLAEHGYELNKNDHILALQADQEVIEAALKSLRWKNRPKLKKTGPEMAMPDTADMENMEDTGPLLVLEQPFRTDSDVGFATYDYEW